MGSVVVGGALRAQSITVQMTANPPGPVAGHFFSSGEALYEIASVVIGDLTLGFKVPALTPFSDTATFSDTGEFDTEVYPGTYVMTFPPGLKRCAAYGDVVDFSRPICPMRLASDDTSDIDLELLRFASVTLDYIEIF
jgi:hypothetical protein